MKLAVVALATIALLPVVLGQGAPYDAQAYANCYSSAPCIIDSSADGSTGAFRFRVVAANNQVDAGLATFAHSFVIPAGASHIVADANLSYSTMSAAMTPSVLGGPRSLVSVWLEAREPACGDPVPPDCPLGYDTRALLDVQTLTPGTSGERTFHLDIAAPEGGFRGGNGVAFLFFIVVSFAPTGQVVVTSFEGSVNDISVATS